MQADLIIADLDTPAGATRVKNPATTPLPDTGLPDRRVRCLAHMVSHNRMMIGVCGQEQTRITYTLAEKIAGYEGLVINSVTTNRADGAAGSFFVLADTQGDNGRLLALAREFDRTPWLDPQGACVTPAAVQDLRIIAPDRCTLLRDALQVISVEYGINIETMVNRTFRDIWQDELGGPDLGPPPAEETPAGRRCREGGYTGRVSVTQMRLELPAGTDLTRLKRRLAEIGPDWDWDWGPRTGRGGQGKKTNPQKATRDLGPALPN